MKQVRRRYERYLNRAGIGEIENDKIFFKKNVDKSYVKCFTIVKY